MTKKNLIAKDLRTTKYKPRIVKPKKGKGSFKRKKKQKKSNPIAKDLRTPKYKQRSVKSKKIYNRKKKTIS